MVRAADQLLQLADTRRIWWVDVNCLRLYYGLMADDGADYLSAEEAAALLGMTSRQVQRYGQDGRLSRVRVGRRWMYTRADVEHLVSSPRRPLRAALPAAGAQLAGDQTGEVGAGPIARSSVTAQAREPQAVQQTPPAYAGNPPGGLAPRAPLPLPHALQPTLLQRAIQGAIAVISLVGMGIVINLITADPPAILSSIPRYPWHFLGGTLALLGALYVWQERLGQRQAAQPRALESWVELPDRQTLLAKVRNLLVDSDAVYEKVIDLELGIQHVPRLVASFRQTHWGGSRDDQPLREPLLSYFLRVEKLLIVGQPGAGKTMLLRDLCRALLDVAEQDPRLPIPVLINLSTFSTFPGSFRDWLAEGLRESMDIEVPIGRRLLGQSTLLLLLDGLDEVAAHKQAAVVMAINTLLQAADPMVRRLAICSRTSEYSDLGVRLAVPAAIELQPISRPDAERALEQAGPSTAGLRAALARDEVIAELMETPLMLTVAARAFAYQPSVVLDGDTLWSIRQSLYDVYLLRMLQRVKQPHWAGPALSRLRSLAQLLHTDNSSLFVIERLQPTQLVSKLRFYLVSGLGFALVVGLSFALHFGLLRNLVDWLLGGQGGALVGIILLRSVGLEGGLNDGLRGLVLGLILGPILALYIGLHHGLDTLSISPAEQMRWSWRKVLTRWRTMHTRALLSGFGTALLLTLIIGLLRAPALGLHESMTLGLVLGLMLGLPVGLFQLGHGLFSAGWTTTLNERPSHPNHGTHASIRNGLIQGGSAGLSLGLVFGLVLWMIDTFLFGKHGTLGLANWLIDGLDIGMLTGVVVALTGGLGEAIKHYVLRLLLWRDGRLPLRLVPFLEACRSILLLRRQGGTYQFIHLTLRDYVAELDDRRLHEIATRADRPA